MQEKKYDKIKYNRRYNEENYERINMAVKKGQKEKIKVAADLAGLSVNAYISKAIAAQMERDGIQYDTADTDE
jgi:predicted HicB family RNase H-like nuclease